MKRPQCSWIRRLYDNSFHEWKLIPLFLIKNSFGSSFKFHSNLFFKRNKIKFFPSFYKEIFLYWKKYLTRKPEIPSCILSQYLWYNENIQVDKNSIYLVRFSEKNINYVSQLFRPDGTYAKIYAILISKFQNKPSNFYFENLFNNNDIDWATIYMLPRLASYNTYMQSCQYKLLNSVLFLNKKLHIFGIKSSPVCSLCNLCDETPLHIFYECDSIKCLWLDLVHYFQNSLVLPILKSKVQRRKKKKLLQVTQKRQ